MASTHQQWDIVSSVGLTALATAAARRLESQRPDGLITDPYAAEFVRAANPPASMLTTSDSPEVEQSTWLTNSAGYIALRSRFFDDYFGANPAEQVVILAAGLDARAYRLDWPTGCVVYEVDQPKVLEFKQRVLDDLNATPTCDRRPVSADLRDDWVAALLDAGFDPAKPTAWLAEGLLAYLPADAEEGLFDLMHELSAPGSVLCVEYASQDDMAAALNSVVAPAASASVGVDVRTLLSTEPRRDCAEWLRSAGWRVILDRIPEAAVRYGRTLASTPSERFGHIVLLVTAYRDC